MKSGKRPDVLLWVKFLEFFGRFRIFEEWPLERNRRVGVVQPVDGVASIPEFLIANGTILSR